jgi:hypothetical protein
MEVVGEQASVSLESLEGVGMACPRHPFPTRAFRSPPRIRIAIVDMTFRRCRLTSLNIYTQVPDPM